MTLRTTFTVGFSVLAMVVLAVLVMKTRVALTLTGIATLLALALEHGVSLLERKGLRRGLAIAGVMVSVLAFVGCLGMLLVPAAMTQGEALLTQLPALMEEVRSFRLFRMLSKHFGALMQFGGNVAASGAVAAPPAGTLSLTPLLEAIGGAVSVMGGVVTIFFLVVFMLAFGKGMPRWLVEQLPVAHRQRYERVMLKVYQATGGYLSGLSLICTINATLTTTVLAVLGLPFFLPLGIVSGFSSMVPYAGPVVAGGFITLLTWVTGGWFKGMVVLIYFLIYGQLEGNVLAPLVFRRTVHVNPLLTLLAVLFCVELAGIIGAMVAVPVVATVQIIVRELLQLRQERNTSPLV
ncbi:AI-2E family transporter [Stigmatella sp. ncwal1]|uniref:AI-2E family transporter n=1 Tax=Stigmatella ashevillensis TaxID=2995309 RepID=A0ABT5DDF3_9BACT|nr:AI-2E family transporter [Stigmatella ashevillena]MDC0711531.1 AI-2E family transporter [Stigmatella ashevillena]